MERVVAICLLAIQMHTKNYMKRKMEKMK